MYITDFGEIKRIMREYFNNVKPTSQTLQIKGKKFPERHKPIKLTQEETESLNRPITSEETESVT